MNITSLFRLAILVAILSFGGCATTGSTPATVSHPGAINAFDSNAYDALVSAQASIEQAKTQVPSTPALKDPLNKVIAAYNVAENAYKAYHASGGQADPAALQVQIDALKVAVAALAQAVHP